MSDDKDFEKWWKSLPHQFISEQSFRNYAENGYKAGKRKGEEELGKLNPSKVKREFAKVVRERDELAKALIVCVEGYIPDEYDFEGDYRKAIELAKKLTGGE